MNGAPYGSYIHDFVMEGCFELLVLAFPLLLLIISTIVMNPNTSLRFCPNCVFSLLLIIVPGLVSICLHDDDEP